MMTLLVSLAIMAANCPSSRYMKYAYEDLSPAQFEELVQGICRRLLGAAVQGFSTGPDGGRDAKFIGTAEQIPSKSEPWSGTTIIQAKHTNGYNAKFSDSEFFSESSASATVAEEVTRINSLIESAGLDHYILFANRKLSALANEKVVAYLGAETGLQPQDILLCGLEQIESWLKDYPGIADIVKLDPIDSPLIVSPDDLAEVVEEIQGALGKIKPTEDQPPVPRTPYGEKNKINKLSDDYADTFRQRYLKYTAQVDQFLGEPENAHILEKYNSAVDEFQLKILAKYDDYRNFDSVLNYLFDLLFARDVDLRRHRKLTRVMVFYMYWNCDIGKDGHAQTYQACTS